VHVAANANAIFKPLIAIEGSPAISITALKSTEEGKSIIVHLRSVSDKDEKIRLLWPAGNPRSINRCDYEEVPGLNIGSEVMVPAMGMLVLKVDQNKGMVK